MERKRNGKWKYGCKNGNGNMNEGMVKYGIWKC